MNRAIARQSSLIVVFVEHACHTGGRGFESRRSRLSNCLQAQRFRVSRSSSSRDTGAMIEVRPLTEEDRPWAVEIETASWGEPVVARLGELVDPTRLPGFIAFCERRARRPRLIRSAR